MKKVVAILLVLITTACAYSQKKKQYQYHNNIPTKNGIRNYIDLNKEDVVNAVENFIDDTINSYNIKTDNLSEYQDHDTLESGRYYPEDEIVITDEPNFFDYELDFVPKWKQKEFDNNTRFVKGVLIHEFIHLYIYQFINECFARNINVNNKYIYFNMFPNRKYYSSEFIEEGICEYVVMKLREGIFKDSKLDCLDWHDEANARKFMSMQNVYGIKYQYSRAYVQKIFENNSFKDALLVILTCEPPSFEELLCPERYYNRLMNHAKDLDFSNFDI